MNMHVKLNSTRPKSTRIKPSKPWNPWTENDDEILRDSLALGHSHASIARNLGRTECAIKTRAQQRGLRMPEGKGRARNWRTNYGLTKISETGKLRKHYANIEEIAAQSPAKNPPVPFVDLAADQCRFVVDDSAGMSMNCCGAPVMGGKGDARKHTHCEHHYKASIGVR